MIELSKVSVRRGDRDVLQEISAQFSEGAFVSIVGPNGAGKSTLLRAIIGVQKIQQGDIIIDGRPVCDMTVQERARSIAWLPQSRPSAWNLMVEDLAALGRFAQQRRPYARCAELERKAIDSALEKAGAFYLKGRPIETLSGGEQARVHLARVLASPAPILLLDEPCAGLDISTQLDVLRVLKQEAETGRLIFAALHELRWALAFTDRTLILHEGRIVADDVPPKALDADTLMRCFGVSAKDAEQFVLEA